MTHGVPPPNPARPPLAVVAAAAPVAPPGTLLITSEQLFAGATEVQIEHRGARYRLKQTSLGKLILTK